MKLLYVYKYLVYLVSCLIFKIEVSKVRLSGGSDVDVDFYIRERKWSVVYWVFRLVVWDRYIPPISGKMYSMVFDVPYVSDLTESQLVMEVKFRIYGI